MSTFKPVTINETVVSESTPTDVEPSYVSHVKTPMQLMKNHETPNVNRKNWNAMMERELKEGYSFTKKKCSVCGSLSHLIKDCDFYEKKMAREAELKKQRVFNTGSGVVKPVWNNANKVNHANHFVPRPVQLNAIRANVNYVRQNVNSVRTHINTIRSKQPVPSNNTNSFSPVRPQVNKFNQRSYFSKSHSPVRRTIVKNIARMTNSHAVKGNWGTAVKTSASYTWRKSRPNSNYNSGSNFVRTVNDHPLKNMGDRGIFDSGCSGHMTGNKDNLEDFEEFKGGSGNLVRGLPSKVFRNDHTCVACHKGKQHKGSCKVKLERLITEPLHTLHMDLFGLTSIKSINHASYCLVITDDCTRFSWVFFLGTKDETSGILQNFIRHIENQLNHRVKIIRSDNGIEFKNRDMLEFCGNKGIKREYSNARTPQQNGVAKRMNMTLIEATRNTLCVLGKFDGKCDEGFLVGYSLNSKAYRVYNLVTKKVEVNLHVNFLEEKPNVKGVGTSDVTNQAGILEMTNSAGTLQAPNIQAPEEEDEAAELMVVPTAVKYTVAKVGTWKHSIDSKEKEYLTVLQSLKAQEKGASPTGISEVVPDILTFHRELDTIAQKHLGVVPENNTTSTTSVNTSSEAVNTSKLDTSHHAGLDDSDKPELKIFHRPQDGIFYKASYDAEGMVRDFNNLPIEVTVSPTPTLRIHNIHLQSQILGDPKSAVQTRSKVKIHSGAYTLISYIKEQQRNNHKDQQHCLFACFLSQEEPKKISDALQDGSWVEAM
ncbi:putative ribonuclease H-like domain-containing protein [Tanacetum coccineum]